MLAFSQPQSQLEKQCDSKEHCYSKTHCAVPDVGVSPDVSSPFFSKIRLTGQIVFRNDLIKQQISTEDFNNSPSTGLSHRPATENQQASMRDHHPLKNRMAVNQLTTLRWSLTQDLAAYRDHGISGIGISWKKLNEYGVLRGIRKIRRSGLPVSNLSWVGGFTGQHGYGLDDAMAEAKRAIRVAGQLRAESVTVVTGPQNRHIDSHANRIVTDSLRKLGDLAALYDVRLALQPMHRIYASEWTFLNTLEDSLEILDQVSHPAVGLALGTFHLLDRPDASALIEQIVDRIAVVVLADRLDAPIDQNDQSLPGEGRLPIREFIAALEYFGYCGWYQTEVWSRDLWKLDHHDLIRRYRRAQRNCLPTLGETHTCGPVEFYPHC